MFRGIKFDRYSQETFGLEAKTDPGTVFIDGVALLTRWLSGGPYTDCSVAVVTVWTGFATITTSWTPA